MRMFLSVSGHSSKLSIANHSSRSPVSQLKCVSTLYQADLRITNHRRQKSPPSFTLLSFKTRIKWPLGWPQPQVFRGFFSTTKIFKATSKLFSSQGYSEDKNWLDFSSIFFKICRFRSSILKLLHFEYIDHVKWFFSCKGGAKGRLSRYVEMF